MSLWSRGLGHEDTGNITFFLLRQDGPLQKEAWGGEVVLFCLVWFFCFYLCLFWMDSFLGVYYSLLS